MSFNQFQQHLYLNLNAVARVKTFTRPEMFLMPFSDETPQLRYKHWSDFYFCSSILGFHINVLKTYNIFLLFWVFQLNYNVKNLSYFYLYQLSFFL